MKKTFCDRHPDRECVNRIGRLNLSVIQQTNKGEVVSEDEYHTMDLCGDCIDDIIATYVPSKLLMMTKEPDMSFVRDEVPIEGTRRNELGSP
jgi:hypothetical protein